ncbi:N-formylglutamate amidohydrolase [Pseudohalocynthiibacter aestuariivivens]|uniref:N-formylglutamate amidohydrolase n=1 Tax=Pseudohalocynthiibacter aestuariivivens TaxID=1591409 RepID=A0ABV5JDQ9_9RHOB|nr:MULTISPECIES: N-formylglutamate amidohydrolase [Pseudohalocynthiibacter]MBS9715590.1 N-formylglutamate amidohydrolase [Pseudohalocynthiibacter aestuariivivens]MCK0101204.1 N-formylglutamate amidohydrolase [Pseudohalocynthiibacter sp. F2068]
MVGTNTKQSSTVVEVLNPDGVGPVVLVCEHASAHIPEAYNNLGLSPATRDSHAVWDPGARALAARLSKALNAPLIAGRVSRLVYDCNRPPESPGAMPEKSELIEVPGNQGLNDEDKAARVEQVYVPFCNAVGEVLEARESNAIPTVLVTIHSFTPLYFGKPRNVEIGILHDTDSRVADAMLAQSELIAPRVVERNSPYGPADGVTHSLKIHGIEHGLMNVMIEVRNDLLETEAAQDAIADELLGLLASSLKELGLVIMGTSHHA